MYTFSGLIAGRIDSGRRCPLSPVINPNAADLSPGQPFIFVGLPVKVQPQFEALTSQMSLSYKGFQILDG